MFGFFEAIYSFLTRQIGLRTDAADPAGSLHAKVANINNTLNNTISPNLDSFKTKRPRFAYVKNIFTTTTVINITGAGFLTGITAIHDSSYIYIKITIDGTVLFDGIANTVYFVRGVSGYSWGHNCLSTIHRFNSSLIVEARSNGGTNAVYVSYVLD